MRLNIPNQNDITVMQTYERNTPSLNYLLDEMTLEPQLVEMLAIDLIVMQNKERQPWSTIISILSTVKTLFPQAYAQLIFTPKERAQAISGIVGDGLYRHSYDMIHAYNLWPDPILEVITDYNTSSVTDGTLSVEQEILKQGTGFINLEVAAYAAISLLFPDSPILAAVDDQLWNTIVASRSADGLLDRMAHAKLLYPDRNCFELLLSYNPKFISNCIEMISEFKERSTKSVSYLHELINLYWRVGLLIAPIAQFKAGEVNLESLRSEVSVNNLPPSNQIST